MELPRVFANPIEKKMSNGQEVFKEGDRNKEMNVKEYISNLYHSGRIPYMIDFRFIVGNQEFTDRIATRTEDYIITKSNRKIDIKDIKYIEEIKKA